MEIHKQLEQTKTFRLNQETIRQLETIVQHKIKNKNNWNEGFAIREAIDLLYEEIKKEMKKNGK